MRPDSTTRRLAIVGASVRAAAQSALRAGFDVVGADLFADADLDGVCPVTKIDPYPDGLADWLATQDVDAWMYTGALENYPDLVDRMAAVAPLWGVSGEPLRRCRDPLVLQAILRDAGVTFPETLSPGEKPDAGDWLAKTYRHSAGVGVWRYGEHPPDTALYAQRVVEGAPMAALFAAAPSGARLLGITEQRLEGYGYRGSHGPVAATDLLAADLAAVGRCLVERLALRGLIGVDFLLAGDRAVVVEINPRYTASVEVLERAFDASAVAAHAACYAEGVSPPRWHEVSYRYAGKQIVFTDRRVVIRPALAVELLRLQREGWTADIPRAGTAIESGGPVCTIMASASSPTRVARGLQRWWAWLQVQLDSPLTNS